MRQKKRKETMNWVVAPFFTGEGMLLSANLILSNRPPVCKCLPSGATGGESVKDKPPAGGKSKGGPETGVLWVMDLRALFDILLVSAAGCVTGGCPLMRRMPC